LSSGISNNQNNGEEVALITAQNKLVGLLVIFLLLVITLQWHIGFLAYLFITLLTLATLFVLVLALQVRFNFIRLGEHVRFGIAVYQGDSPTQPRPLATGDYPVLTMSDVSDVRAKFIADPFVVRDEGNWWMFSEVYNLDTKLGEIALAYSSDGYRWDYQQIVLREPFHLSYPFVFKHEGAFYMIPESGNDNSVWLYRATSFPTHWVRDTQLLEGVHLDSTLIQYEGRWWIFASDMTMGNLNVFYADDLRGPYQPHTMNPVVRDNKTFARPGGRIIIHDGKLIRFGQQDTPKYGLAVHALQVTKLTPEDYSESLLHDKPILSGHGKCWNKARMHHIDPIQMDDGTWHFIVDGGGGNKHYPLVDKLLR
jgi:hypothetical protein